jgi:hypothetical protein
MARLTCDALIEQYGKTPAWQNLILLGDKYIKNQGLNLPVCNKLWYSSQKHKNNNPPIK